MSSTGGGSPFSKTVPMIAGQNTVTVKVADMNNTYSAEKTQT